MIIIKMTVTDQLKIIDDKSKANQAQYDLDRLSAKVSALSSGELRKYKYFTGEDLWYKSKKKDNKTINPLIYDSKHNFYRYRLSNFSKISSVDSKFNKIEEYYNDFIVLKDVDAESENIKHKLVYWMKYQNFMTIWLNSTKKFMKKSLKMVKMIVRSKNMTLKILEP